MEDGGKKGRRRILKYMGLPMADVLIAWVRRLLPDLTGKSPKLRSYTDLIVREIFILKEKSKKGSYLWKFMWV